MRKFYTSVSVNEEDLLCLDKKPVKTQKGNFFIVPPPLSIHIQKEWESAESEIKPHQMPATQIAMTAQDFFAEKKNDWLDEIHSYLDSDLLTHWSEGAPEILKLQQEMYKPILNRLQQFLNTEISVNLSLKAQKQNNLLHEKIKNRIQDLNELEFTCFYVLMLECGSCLLALCYLLQFCNEKEFIEAIFLEEFYKAKIYNEKFYGSAPDFEKKQESIARLLSVARIIFQSQPN